jgi:hypothetical protein
VNVDPPRRERSCRVLRRLTFSFLFLSSAAWKLGVAKRSLLINKGQVSATMQRKITDAL